MTWLSKIGRVVQIAGKVVQVILGFGPGIVALTPNTKDDAVMAKLIDPLTQIAGLIVQVEGMAQALETPLPGPDKLKMATPFVAQIILGSALMAKAEIENPALFKQGCASIASGMADVLNARKDNIETVAKG